ncbi:hypothetical protein MTO96_002500 [Rhipicephalus appendiculatus]
MSRFGQRRGTGAYYASPTAAHSSDGGCRSRTDGYDSTKSAAEKRHFFKPPADEERLQQWRRAIPRLDKELSSSCAVCDLHFQEDDIVKDYLHKVHGDVVVIPRGKWALKEDAVPRIFPNCPKYLSKPARKRKAPTLFSRGTAIGIRIYREAADDAKEMLIEEMWHRGAIRNAFWGFMNALEWCASKFQLVDSFALRLSDETGPRKRSVIERVTSWQSGEKRGPLRQLTRRMCDCTRVQHFRIASGKCVVEFPEALHASWCSDE